MVSLAIFAAVACGQTADDSTSTPVRDERPGGLQGVVTDPAGVPVPGMRVGIVSGTAPFPEIAPETDEEGHYQIGGVAPGTFEVAVLDRDGQRIGLESVVVRSGETAGLNLSIQADAMIEAQPPLPPRPVIRLRYAGQVYEGVEGSYCWPGFRADDGSVVGICADKILWDGLTSAIPVEEGTTPTLEIEAEEQAQALSAGFYEIDSNTQVRSLELGSGPEAALVVDLPEGVYNVAVFGRWPDGDVTYQFRIKVRPGPSTTVPPVPGPGSCQGYLDLLVSFDGGKTEETAVVTSYQCLRAHVDSTGLYPSASASSALAAGSPLVLRLAAETQPAAVDVRLYPRVRASGAFLTWPEDLSDGIEPVDTLRPTASLTFQYVPQQPPGDYSLVVRAVWEGPIVVFYAIILSLN